MSDLLQPAARRMLGKSAIEVSALAWGHWRLAPGDHAANARLAHAALDAGIDFFDTADIYGFDGKSGFGAAEEALGALLAAEPGMRRRLVIASKGGIDPPKPYDSSAAYLEAAIDASLRRLRIDTIDLWQVHRPDILTHPHEIARVVEKVHSAGKIRAFGVSNYTALADRRARRLLDGAPVIDTARTLRASLRAIRQRGKRSGDRCRSCHAGLVAVGRRRAGQSDFAAGQGGVRRPGRRRRPAKCFASGGGPGVAARPPGEACADHRFAARRPDQGRGQRAARALDPDQLVRGAERRAGGSPAMTKIVPSPCEVRGPAPAVPDRRAAPRSSATPIRCWPNCRPTAPKGSRRSFYRVIPTPLKPTYSLAMSCPNSITGR